MKPDSVMQLLRAQHSKPQTDKIIRYIGYDADLFEELLDAFLGPDAEMARRAAWVYGYTAHLFPENCFKRWGKLLSLMADPVIHDALKRNFFRALEQMQVPEELLGETVQVCFDQLMNRQQAVAIRVFAMTCLTNMAQQIPELKPEIRLLLEEELPFSEGGFASRARKELKRL